MGSLEEMNQFTDPSWDELVTRLELELEQRTKFPARLGTDDPAWEEAYRRIRYYSQLLLRTRTDLEKGTIEDVAQEVLLKLQRPEVLRRLRLLRSPTGYLMVMIRNVANDRIRRNKLERESLARLGLDLLSATGKESSEESNEMAAILTKELRLLSPDEKALLKLRFWKNLSIGEIAEELQVSYSATAVRMFRLLRRLRNRLSNWEERWK